MESMLGRGGDGRAEKAVVFPEPVLGDASLHRLSLISDKNVLQYISTLFKLTFSYM